MSDKKNLVMRDYAASDPRSAKAWLRGGGDNRNARFEQFAKKQGTSVGDDVHFAHMESVRKEDGFNAQELVEDLAAMKTRGNSWVVNLLVAVVGLAVGAALAMNGGVKFW